MIYYMAEKVISIIIPVYNVEKYLSKCLQSIFSQQNIIDLIEVIIVNDGSPDNSHLIIEQYARKYYNTIRVHNQENQGLSMARNNGLDMAKGKYVWFVDSDDWLPDGSINNVIREIEANPEIDVFSSFLNEYFEDSESYRCTSYKGELYFSGLEYMDKKFPIGASQRYIYKRDFLNLNHIRFVPKILHEDAVWGYMMLYKAKHIKIISNPIYVYRRRVSDSIMSSITIRSAYDLIKGHKLMCEWMEEYVSIKDRKKFGYLVFGLIKTLLDFTKQLIATQEYRNFLKDNKGYIQRCALKAMQYKPFDISLLIIAIHPKLFSGICKLVLK